MSDLVRLKPINRHLLIVPHVEKNETNTGVLLPEDYTPEQNTYIEATVIDVAEDCSKEIKTMHYGAILETRSIIIDRSMIQEVSLKNRKHYLILENYVVGMYRSTNED